MNKHIARLAVASLMKQLTLTFLVVLTIGARASAAACLLGDADNNGAVSLGELQQCVSNFRGASIPAPTCPPSPPPRFVDNGDGTITDNVTGLRW